MLPVSIVADTRGYTNSNPGNLIKTPTKWLGEVKCPDKKFECFESIDMGIRALVKVLHSYYTKHGLRTNNEIIERFVGTKDRNKHAYILYSMGNSNIRCDRKYLAVIKGLVTVIIRFENGYIKEGLDIDRIINETLPDMVDNTWRCE